MQGMPHTPSEAVRVVARAHARLVERGADHDTAIRLVAVRHGLRPEVARWAVSQGRERRTRTAHHARSPRAVAAAVPRAPLIVPISASAGRANAG